MVKNIPKYNLNITLLRIGFKKLLLCLLVINFALWCPSGTAHAEIACKTSWQSLETRHTIIQYESLKDLEKFNDKIDYSPGEWGFKSIFSGSKDPVVSIKKKSMLYLKERR